MFDSLYVCVHVCLSLSFSEYVCVCVSVCVHVCVRVRYIHVTVMALRLGANLIKQKCYFIIINIINADICIIIINIVMYPRKQAKRDSIDMKCQTLLSTR